MLTNREFADFESASEAVLRFLHDRYGFDLCMVTRVREDRWTVLRTEGSASGLAQCAEFAWSETICSRMIRDEGPCIASRVADIPAYVEAPMRQRFDVKSYIGVPIRTSCGKFFGTLCAIDKVEHPELDDSELPLLELLGGMLSGYARKEIESHELERRSERFHFEAMTDPVTHLPNRRAWEEKIRNEQARSLRIGDTTFISIVEVNNPEDVNDRSGQGARDEILRKTALVLRYAVRNSDFVARIGGEEFAVMGVQCDSIEPEEVSERLRSSLAGAGISAAVGTSVGHPSDSQEEVWRHADVAMHSDRKTRRQVGYQ